MNIFEYLFINIVLILFPLLCYLLFASYQKTYGKETNKIIFDLSIFTSLYLILKYGSNYMNINAVLVVIPLLIAYLKRKSITAFGMSIVIGLYSYYSLNINIVFILLELGTYFIIYIIFKNEKKVDFSIVNFFTIIKTFFAFIEIEHQLHSVISLINLLLLLLFFYSSINLVYYLIKRGEDNLKLRMTLKELDKQKQLRDSLFKITHEIKNPLAVCKGYLDMFDLDNRQHVIKYIPIIRQEIDRTLMIINDFLNLTRLKVDKTRIDLSVVLHDTHESLQMLLKAHDISFKSEIFDYEVYLNADYDRLKQVFFNIIKNAVEAIPKDRKGVIQLTAKEVKKEIVIIVEDNGMGIDSENLKKIGEPFFTTKKGGTGLGVRLSREIIEAHNGKIKYTSKKNIGTVVTITLPIIKNP